MFTRFCTTFLKKLARQTEIKNRSAERLLATKKTFITLNVPLAKTERNTRQVLSSVNRNNSKTSNIIKIETLMLPTSDKSIFSKYLFLYRFQVKIIHKLVL